MMRVFFLLLIFPLCAFAGGTHWKSNILTVDEKQKQIKLILKNEKPIYNCDKLNINISYERVPWFSWIPFINSAHPTKEENKVAITHIKSNIGNTLYFGEIGKGLVPQEKKCTYQSKGAKILEIENKQVIMFYYSQV